MPGLFPRSSIDYFPPGFFTPRVGLQFQADTTPPASKDAAESLGVFVEMRWSSKHFDPRYEGKSSMFGCNHLASEVSKNRYGFLGNFLKELLGIGDLPGLHQHQSFQDYASERWLHPEKGKTYGGRPVDFMLFQGLVFQVRQAFFDFLTTFSCEDVPHHVARGAFGNVEKRMAW